MPSSRTHIIAPLIVGCAQFMHQFDGAVITTALPAMAESLHDDPVRLNLAIACYLLALAVFVPVSADWACAGSAAGSSRNVTANVVLSR